jgi:hypothetical protein
MFSRQKFELSVQGPLISNFQDVVLEGALQGLGILYAYNVDGAREALADGRLRRVLVDWSRTLPGLFSSIAFWTASRFRTFGLT